MRLGVLIFLHFVYNQIRLEEAQQQKDRDIQQKDRDIQQRDRNLQQKDNQLQQKDEALQQKDAELQRLREQFHHLQMKIVNVIALCLDQPGNRPLRDIVQELLQQKEADLLVAARGKPVQVKRSYIDGHVHHS